MIFGNTRGGSGAGLGRRPSHLGNLKSLVLDIVLTEVFVSSLKLSVEAGSNVEASSQRKTTNRELTVIL